MEMMFVLASQGSGGDTIPPTTPSITDIQISSGRLQVYWTTSTDNVAVAGYEVWVKDGTYYLATTTTNTNYRLFAMDNQWYVFKVRAFDAAGNYSAFSNEQQSCQNQGGICDFQ